MWLLGIFAGTALAVDCAAPLDQTSLVGAMDKTEAAYADLDEAGFRDGVNEIAGLMLPCMGEALDPAVTARYHRLMALRLHEIGDTVNAELSVIAARTVAPDSEFDVAMVPDDHPLRGFWSGNQPDDETRKVPEPRYGSLAFDGVIGRDRPKSRPTVAQVFDDTGVAQSTNYLGPREPLPIYSAVPRQRNILIGCTAGAAVGSGITYGMAWGARGSVFEQAADPQALSGDLDSARASTNLLSLVSGGLLGVAMGCGTGALVIGER
jgi:hypothetical protein